MYYRSKEPTEFERRWLERIEQRSGRRHEWEHLRRLQSHRRLYRLGLIALGLCVALLAGGAVFIVLLLVMQLLFLLWPYSRAAERPSLLGNTYSARLHKHPLLRPIRPTEPSMGPVLDH